MSSRRLARRKRGRSFTSCRGKMRYGTVEEAREAQPGQFAYPCQKCGCWHTTSMGRVRAA